MNFSGIIFNGFTRSGNLNSLHLQYPMIGPYKLRTYLKHYDYHINVVDWFDWWEEDDIIQLIRNNLSDNLKLIGFSTTFQSPRNISVKLLKRIKTEFPNLKIVMGGQEPQEDILGNHPEMSKYIDTVIYGHAEEALLEYFKYLDNEPSKYEPQKYTSGVEYIIAPDVIPYTDNTNLLTVWEKADPIKYFNAGTIEISRGCMFKCKFCFSPLIGRKKSDYTRTAENLAEELKRNYDLFGITHYALGDDTFNESNEKLEEIKKGIKLSGIDITFTTYLRYELLYAHKEQINTLLEMGLVGGILGLETFNPESRKTIGKGLNTDQILDLLYRIKKVDNNLRLSSAFISGLPYDTKDHIFNSFDEFLKINKDFEYLDYWYWSPLYLPKNYRHLSSIFMREAKQYGYEILEQGEWINNIHSINTFKEANDISNSLNNLYTKKLNASFQISEMMGFGYDLDSAINYKGSASDLRELFKDKQIQIFEQYKKEKLNG